MSKKKKAASERSLKDHVELRVDDVTRGALEALVDSVTEALEPLREAVVELSDNNDTEAAEQISKSIQQVVEAIGTLNRLAEGISENLTHVRDEQKLCCSRVASIAEQVGSLANDVVEAKAGIAEGLQGLGSQQNQVNAVIAKLEGQHAMLAEGLQRQERLQQQLDAALALLRAQQAQLDGLSRPWWRRLLARPAISKGETR